MSASRQRSASEGPAGAEVHLRLSAGGVRIEYRGSRALYERCIEALVEAAGDPDRPAAALRREVARGPAYRPGAPQLFQQFVSQVGARAETPEQQAMAFAFYLWNYERKEEFETTDIEAFFRTVQMVPPDDLPALLADLADRRRFLASGAGTGLWGLTPKGLNYVKNRLLGPV